MMVCNVRSGLCLMKGMWNLLAERPYPIMAILIVGVGAGGGGRSGVRWRFCVCSALQRQGGPEGEAKGLAVLNFSFLFFLA